MTENDIYRIFDDGGVLSRNFPGYEYREGQLRMASLVLSAFEQNAILAVEAGTGIGKSFAYLVPALYAAMEKSDERTVIATSTINLQRQLYGKDIPNLFKLLGRSCRVSLAVGRAHYLCVRRFQAKREEMSLLSDDPSSELSRVGKWVSETETGLLEEIPGSLSPQLQSEINSDGDLCQGWNCPYRSSCFFWKAKEEQKMATIIVSNHHLLFSDAESRLAENLSDDDDAVLPAFHNLIIDEAHNMESNATDFFTKVYDPLFLKRQLRLMERKKGGKSLLEKLAKFSDAPALVREIRKEITLLIQQSDILNSFLISLLGKPDFQPCLVEVKDQERLSGLRPLARAVSEVSSRLASDMETFLEGNEAPEVLAPSVTELKVRSRRARELSGVLEEFCDFSSWKDDIHWFEPSPHTRKEGGVRLSITPLSIAPLLVDALFRKIPTIVCTSATLSLGDDFSYWAGRVGLPYDDERPFLKATFPSPFDFKRRLLLLTPEDAPSYDRNDSSLYLDYITKTIRESVFSSGGGALVLFTSYTMLKEVKRRLEDDFKEAHMTLLCQGEEERLALMRKFIGESDSTLFATNSFWEGFDAPGQTLRLVIIVKLPFRVPTDPVFKARCEALEREGKSGFDSLSLPQTAMKLKQGFGRLLRSREDRGVVLILDSRIITKYYGKGMIRALPESFHPSVKSEGISRRIESFLFGE